AGGSVAAVPGPGRGVRRDPLPGRALRIADLSDELRGRLAAARRSRLGDRAPFRGVRGPRNLLHRPHREDRVQAGGAGHLRDADRPDHPPPAGRVAVTEAGVSVTPRMARRSAVGTFVLSAVLLAAAAALAVVAVRGPVAPKSLEDRIRAGAS